MIFIFSLLITQNILKIICKRIHLPKSNQALHCGVFKYTIRWCNDGVKNGGGVNTDFIFLLIRMLSVFFCIETKFRFRIRKAIIKCNNNILGIKMRTCFFSLYLKP
jgi:hypothetical protein